ncbi:hypothetical protein L9F63_006734, partial [Diploptera punctata]
TTYYSRFYRKFYRAVYHIHLVLTSIYFLYNNLLAFLSTLLMHYSNQLIYYPFSFFRCVTLFLGGTFFLNYETMFYDFSDVHTSNSFPTPCMEIMPFLFHYIYFLCKEHFCKIHDFFSCCFSVFSRGFSTTIIRRTFFLLFKCSRNRFRNLSRFHPQHFHGRCVVLKNHLLLP